MARLTQLQSDLYVNGNLQAVSMTLPLGSVGNSQVAAGSGAGNGVAASKLQHEYTRTHADTKTVTATTMQKTIHVAHGATGTVTEFRVGAVVANIGAATVTFDLLKNGVSILTGVVTLTNAQAAYSGQLTGTLTGGASYVVGDVFEAKMVATAGGGTLATGIFAMATFTEDAQ